MKKDFASAQGVLTKAESSPLAHTLTREVDTAQQGTTGCWLSLQLAASLLLQQPLLPSLSFRLASKLGLRPCVDAFSHLSIGTRTAYTCIVPMEHVENLVKIYHISHMEHM